jgi:ribosomal protein L31E
MREVVANLEEENGKLRDALAVRAKERGLEEEAIEEKASQAAEALSLAVKRHMKLKEYTVELGSQVNFLWRFGLCNLGFGACILSRNGPEACTVGSKP